MLSTTHPFALPSNWQGCWLLPRFCVCATVRAMGPLRTHRLDVLVAVHYKEYGRSTSTAKLLPLLLPGAASLHPYPEDFEALRLRIAEQPSLLLMPCEGARPARELREWVAARPAPVNLIIVDGTWGNVKSMSRRLQTLDGLMAIHVNDEVRGPSHFTSRRQIAIDKVSTVEAAALALEALGEPVLDGGDHAPFFQTAVGALQALIGAERAQGGVVTRASPDEELNGRTPTVPPLEAVTSERAEPLQQAAPLANQSGPLPTPTPPPCTAPPAVGQQ